MTPNEPDDRPQEGDLENGGLGDLLGDVRADWDALQSGEPLPPAALDAQDAETRAAVSWMQAAWTSTAGSDVPPIPVELVRAHQSRMRPAGRERAPRRAPRRALWIAASIAAIALAMTGAMQLQRGTHSGTGATSVDGTREDIPSLGQGRVAAGHPVNPTVADQAVPTRLVPTPLGALRAAAPTRSFTADQFVSRPDGVEIVTGKVRLILLQTDR